MKGQFLYVFFFHLIFFHIHNINTMAPEPSAGAAGATTSASGSMDGFYHPDEDEQAAAVLLPDYITEVKTPRTLLPIFASLLAEQKIKGRRVLFVFDVDHTLGDCTDPRLAESAYSQNIAIRLTLVPESQFLHYPLASVFDDHFEMMSNTAMRPLKCDHGNVMSAAIKFIYEQGELCMAGTSRSPQYSDITAYKHLKQDLDIDFDQTLHILDKPNLEILFDTSPRTSFSHAIAFCSGTPKARVIQHVLPHLDLADPLIVYVDDKLYHLEDMHATFGDRVIPIFLNTPEDPIQAPTSPISLKKALYIPLDVRADISKRPFQTLANLLTRDVHHASITSTERLKACESLIEAIFAQLPFPKSQQLSREQLDNLIDTYLGPITQRDKNSIIAVLTTMQVRIKKAAPEFGFLKLGDKDYVALYIAKQDDKHQLITEMDGKTLVYNDPIMFPVDLLYACNRTYLETKSQQEDLPHRTLMRRALSTAEWPNDSPPSTPGPLTSKLEHSDLFPKSP